MKTETWKPVVGWEAAYEVSDQGRVRSVERIDAAGRKRRGRILKPSRSGSRRYYLSVDLHSDGRRRFRPVHKLVAEAFLGPCPEGHEVCHGPLGPLVNSVNNLRYGTRAENFADRKQDQFSPFDDWAALENIREDDVRTIHALAGTMTRRKIGDQFGLTASMVSNILDGRILSHIEV